MNNNIQLSVLIPTYNRKTQLANTLDTLENQTKSNFKIVISDNHSDYDINDVLKGRSKSFIERITVFRRRQNVGIDANIANLFTLCKTKWAWFLPDDDTVKADAAEKILAEIESRPDMGAFDFHMDDFDQVEHFRIDTNLTDFIDFYYPMHRKMYGNLIYLGNKVFNLERINDCIDYVFKYNYTGLSMVVLIYRILESHIPFCTVFNSRIVEYNTGVKCSWNLESVILGTRTLMDIPFELNSKYLKKMLIISTFEWQFAIGIYNLSNKTVYDKRFLKQVYHGLYKHILPFDQRILFRIYIILVRNKFGFNLLKALRKAKAKTRKLIVYWMEHFSTVARGE